MPKKGKKKKVYKIELTAVSASCWGAFLLFLLAWIFVLGIMAGRGFVPESVTTVTELKSQARKLQERVSREDLYEPGTAGEPDLSPELTFFEKLEMKKDDVRAARVAEREETTPKKTISSPKPVKIQEESVKKPASQDIIPEDTRRAAGSDFMYTIQLASISDGNKAVSLVKELVDKGYDAYYYSVEVGGKLYYRIRCGRFSDREQALKYAIRLEIESGLKGFVARID